MRDSDRVPPPPSIGRPPTPPKSGTSRWLTWCVRIVSVLVIIGGVGFWWVLREGERIVDQMSAGYKAPIVADARGVLGTDATGYDDVNLPAAMSNKNTATMLLIGSDTRDPAQGGNSDTMILARLDDTAGTVSLLSVPRDLKVPIPGHSPFKVNASYALGGPALAIETLRDYLGVRIDHFAVVDFASFMALVDTVGGVFLSVDQRYHNRNDGSAANNYADIDLQPGYQKLGGADALTFARYRHGDSDYFRQARQQLFLSELKRVAEKRMNPKRPDRMRSLLDTAAKATTSDISSLSTMVDLVSTVRDVDAERVYRFTIPGKGWIEEDGRYYLHATDEQVQAVVAEWLDPEGAPAAPQPDRSATGDSEAVTADAVAADDETVSDDNARALIQEHSASAGINACVPTRRPDGSYYPTDGHRAYTLNGAGAIAISGRIGPGRHYLWMWSGWADPPVLAKPSTTRRIDGREYRLYRRAGHLHVVAFPHRGTTVWLTNTLRGELSEKTMLAMARSCT